MAATGSGRWDPTHELLRLQDRFNRLFGHGDEDQLISGSWSPPCDILETKEAVILKAELPGVLESDISIQVEGGVLTLRGQKNFQKETEEQNYHRIERPYGSFVRSFTLPRTVDSERIAAKLHNGVLEVVMTKREETKPRQIRVDVE